MSLIHYFLLLFTQISLIEESVVKDNQNTQQKQPVQHLTKQQKTLKGIFLCLGISSLLPFNCVIVPVDYYTAFYDGWFLTAASLSYNAGNFLCTILMTFQGYKWNKTALIFTALFGWMFCLIAIPIFKLIDDQTARDFVTLIPIIIAGILNGFFFPSIVGMASIIDPALVTEVSAGNGIAALIPQFLLIILKAIVGSNSTSDDALYGQTLSYFIIASLWMIVSIIIYIYLLKLNLPQLQQQHKDSENLLSTEQDKYTPQTPFKQLFKQLFISALSVLLIFWCTLSIFPTITTLIPCNNLARKGKLGSDNSWWNIGVMTTFMIFDYISRSFPGWVKGSFKLSRKWCLIITIIRIPVFFTLFLLEALPKYECDDNGDNCSKGPIISSDIVSLLTMIVFASTNGFLNTIAMVNYSQYIQEQDKSQASSIMGFMLNCGLFLGGLTSLAIGVPLNQ